MTIPTLITLLRIAFIPILVMIYYLPFPWARPVAAAIFALAAMTDWLDGYLARKLNQTSDFGAFLDPVADKLMVAVALVVLVQSNPSIWLAIPSAIIIGREITVSALRERMAEVGEKSRVSVNILGKIKTVAQMVAIIFLLYQEPIMGIPIETIGFTLLYMAVVLTLWSMAIYLSFAWSTLTK